jgi:hypothetical protein
VPISFLSSVKGLRAREVEAAVAPGSPRIVVREFNRSYQVAMIPTHFVMAGLGLARPGHPRTRGAG